MALAGLVGEAAAGGAVVSKPLPLSATLTTISPAATPVLTVASVALACLMMLVKAACTTLRIWSA
jgi:hypothetical protein